MKTPFHKSKKWIGLLVRIFSEILKLALLTMEFPKKILFNLLPSSRVDIDSEC